MKKPIRWVPFLLLLAFFVAPWRLLIPAAHAQARAPHTVPFIVELPINPALAPPMPVPQSSCVSQAPSGTHGITVCWTASTSTTVTGYNVYAGTATGGPYTKQNAALVSGTSFFYATPNLGGVKQFIVLRSFDGTAESVNSTEISVTALGNPLPPTAPAAVAASARWRTQDNL